MRLVCFVTTFYYFILQHCCSYQQLLRSLPYLPNYQYPPEPQVEQFVLYPGKYDITLRRPHTARRHRHGNFFPDYQKVYSWNGEEAIQQPSKLNNPYNGLDMDKPVERIQADKPTAPKMNAGKGPNVARYRLPTAAPVYRNVYTWEEEEALHKPSNVSAVNRKNPEANLKNRDAKATAAN